MKGNADGKRRNKPLLYMVNVTAKYMTKLPNTKKVFTAVQKDISNPSCTETDKTLHAFLNPFAHYIF